MHFNNVIHSDLNSRNIFIKNNQIKIGRFDLFKKNLNDKNDVTESYKSPEWFYQEQSDFKSDIWY